MSLEAMQEILGRQDRFRTIVSVILLVWLAILWFYADTEVQKAQHAVTDSVTQITPPPGNSEATPVEIPVTGGEAQTVAEDEPAVRKEPEPAAVAVTEANAENSLPPASAEVADAASPADAEEKSMVLAEPVPVEESRPVVSEQAPAEPLREAVSAQAPAQALPEQAPDKKLDVVEKRLIGPLVSAVVSAEELARPDVSTAIAGKQHAVEETSADAVEPPPAPYEDQAAPVHEKGTPYGRMVRRMVSARRAFWDGHPKQAIVLYRQSADLDAENFLAMEEMARIYQHTLQQPGAAAKAYGEALRRMLPLGYHARINILMRQILELDPVFAVQLNHEMSGKAGFPMDLERIARMIERH